MNWKGRVSVLLALIVFAGLIFAVLKQQDRAWVRAKMDQPDNPCMDPSQHYRARMLERTKGSSFAAELAVQFAEAQQWRDTASVCAPTRQALLEAVERAMR